MPKPKHTPEPWFLGDDGEDHGNNLHTYKGSVPHSVLANGDWQKPSVVFRTISDDWRDHDGPVADECRANARRIVACVNALSSFSTEDLESKSTGEWLDGFRRLAALERVAEAAQGFVDYQFKGYSETTMSTAPHSMALRSALSALDESEGKHS